MNYNVTNTWQTLSEIMGNDYDNTKEYRIHNNVAGVYQLATALESESEVGAIMPSGVEIYNDVGVDLYIKVITKSKEPFTYNNAVYITEVGGSTNA